MNLIIASNSDSASINLRERLLEMSSWKKCGTHGNNDMWELTETSGDFCVKGTRLISINQIHIHAEQIDEIFEKENNAKIDNIIFLSRHKAASGKPSLTVHPIGNWGEAEYGGIEGKITPASPKIMTSLLRKIKENQIEGFDVCFEATHHGPLLKTPTLFLEIGSTELEWENKTPAKALIKSLLEVKYLNGKNVLGIGGGHYTPRFTEAALTHKVSFGHIVANYGVPNLTEEMVLSAIKSGNSQGIYFHKKGMKKSEYKKWKVWAEKNQVDVFKQSDYEPLNA
tara:strand:+ start:1092 stop:1940 length:849 start_codon:yes stop_codon:yes gene_type:complete